MSDIEDILNSFVLSKSQFFNLPDGEEATVKFLSTERVVTNFNGSRVDAIRYHFEINGKEMLWDRTSRELAKQMSKFSKGDLLWIRRIGQKNQTKYDVKKVG